MTARGMLNPNTNPKLALYVYIFPFGLNPSDVSVGELWRTSPPTSVPVTKPEANEA